MPDLQDLYQDIILDHYRNPRNFRRIERANRHAEGSNSLCGDKLSVYAEIEDDVIRDIGFTGTGCAVFIASASVMTESVRGKTIGEAEVVSERFYRLMDGSADRPDAVTEKLLAFSGLREYPARVKCATLPWQTLRAALEPKSRAADAE